MCRPLAGFALMIAVCLVTDDRSALRDDAAQKERLADLQQLVGSWRGVAQPQRGSTKDSWIEEADWAWSFAENEPALVAKLPKAKYFSHLRLTAGATDSGFVLAAKPAAAGDDVRYSGTLDDQ